MRVVKLGEGLRMLVLYVFAVLMGTLAALATMDAATTHTVLVFWGMIFLASLIPGVHYDQLETLYFQNRGLWWVVIFLHATVWTLLALNPVGFVLAGGVVFILVALTMVLTSPKRA